jgi:molybdenum cofactor cytidylyltransferase
MKVAAVILAAGASRRMGRSKLLLPWRSGTVLEHLVGQWRALGVGQVGVVMAEGDEAIRRELDRLGIADRILNPRPDRGMFSSIQGAALWAGWSSATSHWVVSLGDQPQVRLDTLRQLLECSARNPGKICQPGRRGHPRHPVVIPGAVWGELARSREEHLQAFLAGREGDRFCIPCEDEGLDIDVDTPEDYRVVLERFGGDGAPG